MKMLKKSLTILLAVMFIAGSFSVMANASVMNANYTFNYDRSTHILSWEPVRGAKSYKVLNYNTSEKINTETTSADISSLLTGGPESFANITIYALDSKGEDFDYESLVISKADADKIVPRVDITLNADYAGKCPCDYLDFMSIDTEHVTFASAVPVYAMNSKSGNSIPEDEPMKSNVKYNFRIYYEGTDGYAVDSFSRLYISGKLMKDGYISSDKEGNMYAYNVTIKKSGNFFASIIEAIKSFFASVGEFFRNLFNPVS